MSVTLTWRVSVVGSKPDWQESRRHIDVSVTADSGELAFKELLDAVHQIHEAGQKEVDRRYKK